MTTHGVCRHCERRIGERASRLRAMVTGLQSTVDALTDALEDAEALCGALAWHLQTLYPDFVDDLMDDDERELWDAVQPFGPDDPPEEGAEDE